MKYYLRFLIVPLLLGSVTFVLWGVRYRDLGATFVLLETAFQRVPLDPEGITELLPRYLPLLLFQIFYGTMIYRHFCTASVYFSSRKTNRVKWFLPECAKLWFYAIAYSAVLLFSAIGTVGMTTGVTRELSTLSTLTIALLMFAGRVGSVSFAMALIERRARPSVTYPTENLTIG